MIDSENTIIVLPALLWLYFHETKFLHAASLGSIGSIVGHELAHGLQHGGFFEGNDEIESQFRVKKSCYEHQYFKAQGSKLISGSSWLEEDFADNIGLLTAYNVIYFSTITLTTMITKQQ